MIVTTLLIVSATIFRSAIALTLLALGLALLIYKPFRIWIATQLYLVIATLRNL